MKAQTQVTTIRVGIMGRPDSPPMPRNTIEETMRKDCDLGLRARITYTSATGTRRTYEGWQRLSDTPAHDDTGTGIQLLLEICQRGHYERLPESLRGELRSLAAQYSTQEEFNAAYPR